MLKNYLKIAIRNLWRNKAFSAINIGGLAIGIAACLIILQYVGFELSYDQFHSNAKNIYRITKKYIHEGKLEDHSAMTYTATGPAMKATFPEVTGAATIGNIYGSGVISYGNTRFNEEKVIFADSSFLSLFSFPLISGSPAALATPNNALLSQTAARKYFGKADPIGKVIKLNKNTDFLVKGVFRDVPPNSHIHFDFILSVSFDRNWNNFDYYTYVQLAPGTDHRQLQAKMGAFVQKNGMDSLENRFELQPLSDIHLYSNIRNEAAVNGNIRSVYFLLTIAAFILAIAWVNYINLSTAKAIRRAREVGIRKVVGAEKGQLVKQFLLESVMINTIALALAVLLLVLLLPYFAQLTNKPLWSFMWGKTSYWLSFGLFFLLGTFLSGVYPAFVLSSFKPIAVLKGFAKTSGSASLRKALVTVQFAASVILIIGTFTVFRQLQFMRSQDLGMNLDQTLVLVAPKIMDNSRMKTFKAEALRQPAITAATISSSVPGKEIWSANPAYRLNTKPDNAISVNEVDIDEDFIKTYQIKLAAGRNFSESGGADALDGILLNETAVTALGYENPDAALLQKVVYGGDTLTIVGVLKNYHQESFKNNVNPIIFKPGISYNNFYSLKVNTQQIDKTITTLQTKYAQFFPDDPFEFFFLDAFFNKQYHEDQQLGQIFLLFACLAILVACLGLFGLASFTITQRTKEIGVRKVLGASISNIVVLLSWDFLKLVLLAFVIAWPVAWYAMHNWLQDFAYRIQLTWGIFALAGVTAIVIALITVSFQAIKSAVADPVKSLRSE